MNSKEKMLAQLEAMSLDQAREKISHEKYGQIGSQNHEWCSAWLAAKEANQRDSREKEALQIARRANKLAIVAIILSIIIPIGITVF